jgi:phosphate transport system substrate-binding protein
MRHARRALMIVAASALVSCGGPPNPATTPTLNEALLNTDAIRIYATTSTLPLVNDLTNGYGGFNTELQLSFETRSGNYRTMLERLLNGEMPYFVSNHLPADSPLWGVPIGQDGIAVIVHPQNTLPGLTLDQLRAIFQGQVNNWMDVGGADLPMTVITRENGSGTRAEFEDQVMGSRPTTGRALIAPSSAAMIASVAETPGAVGYVSLAYVEPRVRPLALNGVVPVSSSISASSYPLRTMLFVVGLEEPHGMYRNFIGWIQSPAGQAIVARQYGVLLPTPTAE